MHHGLNKSTQGVEKKQSNNYSLRCEIRRLISAKMPPVDHGSSSHLQAVRVGLIGHAFPSSPGPLYQNEVKCVLSV